MREFFGIDTDGRTDGQADRQVKAESPRFTTRMEYGARNGTRALVLASGGS